MSAAAGLPVPFTTDATSAKLNLRAGGNKSARLSDCFGGNGAVVKGGKPPHFTKHRSGDFRFNRARPRNANTPLHFAARYEFLMPPLLFPDDCVLASCSRINEDFRPHTLQRWREFDESSARVCA